MMFKKALTKSGRRILRAIKKISAPKSSKTQYLEYESQNLQNQKQQEKLQQQRPQQAQPQEQPSTWRQQTQLYFDLGSSSSLPSLVDAKSVDTFVTYVGNDNVYPEFCCCCHCDERDENERNENLENEMMR